MERVEAESVVKEQTAEILGVNIDKIGLETRFDEDLDADSLDQTEISIAIEETVGVRFTDDDLEKLSEVKTVGEAVEFVVNVTA